MNQFLLFLYIYTSQWFCFFGSSVLLMSCLWSMPTASLAWICKAFIMPVSPFPSSLWLPAFCHQVQIWVLVLLAVLPGAPPSPSMCSNLSHLCTSTFAIFVMSDFLFADVKRKETEQRTEFPPYVIQYHWILNSHLTLSESILSHILGNVGLQNKTHSPLLYMTSKIL